MCVCVYSWLKTDNAKVYIPHDTEQIISEVFSQPMPLSTCMIKSKHLYSYTEVYSPVINATASA